MTAKEYLSQYRNLDIKIDGMVEERERLYSRAKTVGGSIIDGTPKSAKSDNTAKHEKILDRIMELDDMINSRIDGLIALRHEINAAINAVDDDRLRMILRLKYVNGHTLESIALDMGMSHRHMCRLHGQALKEVEAR